MPSEKTDPKEPETARSESLPEPNQSSLSGPLSCEDPLEYIRNSPLAKLYKEATLRSDKASRTQKVRLFSTTIRPLQSGAFSTVLGKLIPAMISEGWLMTDICALPGMPHQKDIQSWKQKHEQFRNDLDAAYKARAEVMHDRAIKVADASKFATCKQDSIKVETMKWSAERSDPERFSSRRETQTNNYAFFFQSSFNPSNPEPRKVVIETRDPAVVFAIPEKSEEQGDEESDSISEDGHPDKKIPSEGEQEGSDTES